MIKYIKLYLEPNSKELAQKAFDSAKEYFKDKPMLNYSKRTIEFTSYQRGYINAYRRTYATTKLKEGVV